MDREKVRYLILAETLDKKLPRNFSTFDTDNVYGISREDFVEQINFLVNSGYITKPLYADDTVYFYSSTVTEKGEQYLKDNSGWKKAYRAAKELKSWIPFLN